MRWNSTPSSIRDWSGQTPRVSWPPATSHTLDASCGAGIGRVRAAGTCSPRRAFASDRPCWPTTTHANALSTDRCWTPSAAVANSQIPRSSGSSFPGATDASRAGCCAAGRATPHPLVVQLCGIGGSREEYETGSRYLLERGVSALLVDAPGQGETRLFEGLYLDEHVTDAIHAVRRYRAGRSPLQRPRRAVGQQRRRLARRADCMPTTRGSPRSA